MEDDKAGGRPVGDGGPERVDDVIHRMEGQIREGRARARESNLRMMDDVLRNLGSVDHLLREIVEVERIMRDMRVRMAANDLSDLAHGGLVADAEQLMVAVLDGLSMLVSTLTVACRRPIE